MLLNCTLVCCSSLLPLSQVPFKLLLQSTVVTKPILFVPCKSHPSLRPSTLAMHITTFFSVLAAATIAAAAPQSSSLNDLPACAQQAGLASIDATGCDLTDIKCICSSVPFISTLRSYIEAHCTASDQAGKSNHEPDMLRARD